MKKKLTYESNLNSVRQSFPKKTSDNMYVNDETKSNIDSPSQDLDSSLEKPTIPSRILDKGIEVRKPDSKITTATNPTLNTGINSRKFSVE